MFDFHPYKGSKLRKPACWQTKILDQNQTFMHSNNNLKIILFLVVVLTTVFLLTRVSYYFLLFPAIILVIGLISNRLTKWLVNTIKLLLNLIIQVVSKTLLTIFFFGVLLVILFFQAFFQKFNSLKTSNTVS